jgi:tropomyosin
MGTLYHSSTDSFHRIRELDTKAEHYERQIHRLEQERDDMEKKYEVCHSS